MLDRLASPFTQFGPLGGTCYLIDQLLLRLPGKLRLYVYDFMVQPITGEPLAPERLVSKLEIKEIVQGDPELERMPPPQDIIQSRIDQGAFCIGAYAKGEVAAYIWFREGCYLEDEVRCEYVLAPADASVFDFDLYVYPKHRLGLAFIGLWSGANQLLYDKGIRHSFSRLTRYNVASKKAHDHLGWRRVAGAVTLKLGRVELMFASTRPYLAWSWSPSSIPRLHFNAES